MKVMIVMPAYMAAKTIKAVFQRIPKEFYNKLHKIIIVNDGSTDNTLEVAESLKKQYKKIKIISHMRNKGYGAAQKTGFNEVLSGGGDVGILLHSDGQYPPELLSKMIKPIEEGKADIVLGSRILGGKALQGGMPVYKYVGNRVLTTIENIAYGMNISEYHTGYMVYSKNALKKIPFNKLSNTFHFDGEMIMMSGKKKLRIAEVPIPTRYAEEKSYLNPIKYGVDVFTIILKNFLGNYNF